MTARTLRLAVGSFGLAVSLAALGLGVSTMASGSSAGDPRRLGSCPDGIEIDEPTTLLNELRYAESWQELDGPPTDRGDATQGRRADAVGDDRARFVDFRVSRTHHGRPDTGRLRVSDQALAGARSELADGARILFGIGSEPRLARLVVSLRRDGSVAFLGACQYGLHAGQFARYAERARAAGATGSDADLFLSLISGGVSNDEADKLGLHPPQPTWEQLPPTLRHLDPEAEPRVPQDILDGLNSVILKYELPVQWRDFPASLCTRTSIGWNECVSFAAVDPGEHTATFSYVVPGEGLEIWLVGAGGETNAPIALLQQLTPEEVSGEEPLLVGDPTIVSLDAMVERAKDGERRIFCYTSQSVKDVACT